MEKWDKGARGKKHSGYVFQMFGNARCCDTLMRVGLILGFQAMPESSKDHDEQDAGEKQQNKHVFLAEAVKRSDSVVPSGLICCSMCCFSPICSVFAFAEVFVFLEKREVMAGSWGLIFCDWISNLVTPGRPLQGAANCRASPMPQVPAAGMLFVWMAGSSFLFIYCFC